MKGNEPMLLTPSTNVTSCSQPGPAQANEPYFERVFLTPADAEELLGYPQTVARNPRQIRVDALRDDMLAGAYKFNGDPIKLGYGEDGSYPWRHDGNHRLMALLAAGKLARLRGQNFKGIWTAVAHYLPFDGCETQDTGAARLFADILRSRKIQYHTAVAAIARSIDLREQLIMVHTNKPKVHPSVRRLSNLLERHPELIEAGYLGQRVHNDMGKCIAPAIIGEAWFLFHQKDPEQATKFINGLRSPQKGYEAVRQAGQVREWIFTYRGDALTSSDKLTALVDRWNAYRMDDNRSVLSTTTMDTKYWMRREDGTHRLLNSRVPQPV